MIRVAKTRDSGKRNCDISMTDMQQLRRGVAFHPLSRARNMPGAMKPIGSICMALCFNVA